MILPLQNKISNLKTLIKDHKLGQFIEKFDDITHLSGYNIVICTLEGGIKLKFFLPIENDWIWVNVFGDSKIPLRIGGKVDNNITKEFRNYLAEIENKPEIKNRLIPLLKFYIKVVELVADSNSFKIPPSHESKIRKDVKQIVSSMLAHGMNDDVDKIFGGYSQIQLD